MISYCFIPIGFAESINDSLLTIQKICSKIYLYYVTKWLQKGIMRRDVFQAIADPNRRAILALLAQQRLTLNGVAENFRISRPAVSRHIKILKECGLVVVIPQGRERFVEARFDKLGEVSDWVEQYRQIWEDRFNRLDVLLETMKKEK